VSAGANGPADPEGRADPGDRADPDGRAGRADPEGREDRIEPDQRPGLAASSLVTPRLSRRARLGNMPFVALIRVYRVTLSPIVGGQCRFEPTCSVYALEAYRLWGPIRGTRLTLSRILRCTPLSRGGLDPVPIPEHPGGAAKEHTSDGHQTPGGAEA